MMEHETRLVNFKIKKKRTNVVGENIQTSCREIDMVIRLKCDGWVNKRSESRAARSSAEQSGRACLVRTEQEVQIAVGVDIG